MVFGVCRRYEHLTLGATLSEEDFSGDTQQQTVCSPIDRRCASHAGHGRSHLTSLGIYQFALQGMSETWFSRPFINLRCSKTTDGSAWEMDHRISRVTIGNGLCKGAIVEFGIYRHRGCRTLNSTI